MERYLLALGLTIVVETVLACLVLWRRRRRLAVDVPLMNLFTHPLLHLARGVGLPILGGEVAVMAVEMLIYRGVTGLSVTWSLGLAIGLNALTWMLGFVLFA